MNNSRFPENFMLPEAGFLDCIRRMMFMKKIKLFAAAVLFLCVFMGASEDSFAGSFRYPLDEDGELVIVIDPGHGGKNLGADYNGFLEKEMNMTVANAMYEELAKYDGIKMEVSYKVYKTDTGELCTEGKTGHCFLNKELRPIRMKRQYPELFSKLKGMLEE